MLVEMGYAGNPDSNIVYRGGEATTERIAGPYGGAK